MRRFAVALAASAALAGCATTGGDYPRVRYASAFEAGPVAVQLAGRPSAADLESAEDRWGRAIGDAYACEISPLAVSEAGMIGALELAAMSAASRGRQDAFDGVLGFMAALGRHGFGGQARPDPARCSRLDSWVAETRREGRSVLLDAAEDRLIPPR